jgi:polyhydroxybutyrate depolymerase
MTRFQLNLLLAFFLLTFSNLLAQKTLDKTIQHGGLTRQYRLYVPANYDGSKSVPLLFNFHGFGSSNIQQEFYGDFRPISDVEGFIICLPLGTLTAEGKAYFNVGFFPSKVDDIGFTHALIDSISATYKINQRKVFSTGMSNGGFMSYHLACNSSRFAAIASVTGSFTEGTYKSCKPARPIPVMEIHGTADSTVLYNGSAKNATTSAFLPIDSVVQYWVKFNQCSPNPKVEDVPNNIVFEDNLTAEHFVWSGGKAGTTVEHFKVKGGAHTWPGAFISIGATCLDFRASDEVWRFFKQYSLPVGANDILDELSFKIYPNPTDNQLTIETDGQTIYQAQIIDLQGKVIQKRSIIESNITLDVADLPTGIYVLRISSDKGQINKKFVKQ